MITGAIKQFLFLIKMVQLLLMIKHHQLTVIGGGLAGSEAAWQAAQCGIRVRLYEMRPEMSTGAHTGADLAELVCSNSFGSSLPDHASGILINELHHLQSMLIHCAENSSVPAGSALAVDRHLFARTVTEKISTHPNIELIRKEVTEIPGETTIIASGPLTSRHLADKIAALAGEMYLFFYDAIAPIVTADSIDMSIAFRSSRYGRNVLNQGDYINCPLNEMEYDQFVAELQSANTVPLRAFEEEIIQGVRAGIGIQYFEGCLPIEIIARRGRQALAFGPMRPVGIRNPNTGKRPHAIVQLRQDNLAGTQYNLVGFQTNLTYSEQRRVFRLIPGLEKVEFVRFGQMHRNTFLASPNLLHPSLQYRDRANLFFAGQITGVEGYLGNIATGLLAGLNAARIIQKKAPLTFPPTTIIGALCYAITHADIDHFQPIKANLGILPPLETTKRVGRKDRAQLYARRAEDDYKNFLVNIR